MQQNEDIFLATESFRIVKKTVYMDDSNCYLGENFNKMLPFSFTRKSSSDELTLQLGVSDKSTTNSNYLHGKQDYVQHKFKVMLT